MAKNRVIGPPGTAIGTKVRVRVPTPRTTIAPILPAGSSSPWRRDQRFVSFAERYVLERASTFQVGNEKANAWAATLDARAIYLHIESLSKNIDKDSAALDKPASP